MNLLQNKKLQKKILNINGWLSLEEGLLLYHLAKTADKNGPIVEIGSFLGKSTIFMAQALSEIKKGVIYAIDPHIGQVMEGKRSFKPTSKRFIQNISDFHVKKFVRSIRKTSLNANINWNKPISLLFIDGLHEYKNVKNDIQKWWPYVIQGGIVACHDAFGPFPDVYTAMKEEIFAKNEFRYVSMANSIIYVIKGKPGNSFENILKSYNYTLIRILTAIVRSRVLPESIKSAMIVLGKKLISLRVNSPTLCVEGLSFRPIPR